FPVIIFGLGASHWFLRDDWSLIAGRDLSASDLFTPANAHWVTLPVLVFRGLWRIFGLRDYTPYQSVTVALHLTTAVLLRVIMRRAGVRPWIATCAAGSFVLFGPGEANITWAFQMTVVGSLVLGLTHL